MRILRRLLVVLFVAATAIAGPMASPGQAANHDLTIDSVVFQSPDVLLVSGSFDCSAGTQYRVEVTLSQQRGGRAATGYGYVEGSCSGETGTRESFEVIVARTFDSTTFFRRGPATASVSGYVLWHDDYTGEDLIDPLSGVYKVQVR